MSLVHSALFWILGLVVIQRLAELALAGTNTRRLLERGAREVGRAHYPFFILLHGSWLIAIAATTPIAVRPIWPLVGIFAGLQLLRIWVILTLGPYWTTRVITVAHAPLVRTGPFRVVRHPNYWIVVGEIAVLPLAFGDWLIALIWSILNALLLRHRLTIESAALAERQALSALNFTERTRPAAYSAGWMRDLSNFPHSRWRDVLSPEMAIDGARA